MEEEKKDKGFVIKDRRFFDDSGSVRQEEASTADEMKPGADSEGRTSPPKEEKKAQEGDETPLPEINFSSFIFSLSTTAMYHFGDFPDPTTKDRRRNLAAAKQTIDLLSILKGKTEGNLEEDEEKLLDDILYELRMRYVKEKSP